MTTIPGLHPRCLADTEIVRVKQLRLVSKEVGRLALSSVVSCEVHLGEGGGFPTPQQLAGLLAGVTLKQLHITVTVSSGVRQIHASSSVTAVCKHFAVGMG